MAIKYKVVSRKKPGDDTAPPKFYALAVSSGKISLRPIAKRISQISTMSTIDVLGALESFVQVIPEELANGNIVSLGDFGSFSISLNSDGAETEEDFSSSMIKKYSIRFRPGKLLKDVVNTAGYVKE